MKRIVVLFSLFFSFNTLAAPCAEKAHRDFDFWLGLWEVSSSKGQVVGHNKIKRINPCLILESWRGKKGSQGTSMNYFDPQKGKWVQHWVSGDGTIIHLEGEFKNQAMSMVGTIYYAKSKKTFPFKGEWAILADQRVRQTFHQQDPKNQKWNPWFDGYYKKQTKPSH